ncbi:hypothetical protein [Streptomyces beijiangensis]|uniref:Uncharacterized protein n=1 Tax=Streptomyces beijiangensis TaxID=163361 RepID=A0A939FA74_9ACTN|nr:hypothetical protein [Streptomyces beijiangensis]MBO0514798.1 hypothetical protein [Streptomyces beijiangensis]
MTHQLTALPGLEEIRALVAPANVPGQSIQVHFESFHELNPWVHRQLASMTEDCINRGFDRIGIGMLFELLRWRYGAATRGDEFRLNNNYRSRYVRLLIDEHPEWACLFETRTLRAA